MPYIDVTTNQSLPPEHITALKTALGEAITAFPGKSEAWLMVNVKEGAELFFKGDVSPCAMFDVHVFGSLSDAACDAFTEKVCQISQERLGVPADRTYVKYSGYSHWGWNNMNF